MYVYVTSFAVTGHGAIPQDMLRYDHCTSMDNRSWDELPDQQKWQERTVEITHTGTVKRWQPTAVRWGTFGWTVSDVRTVRVAK